MHFAVLSQTCHSHRRLRLPPLTTATCATLDTQSFSPWTPAEAPGSRAAGVLLHQLQGILVSSTEIPWKL